MRLVCGDCAQIWTSGARVREGRPCPFCGATLRRARAEEDAREDDPRARPADGDERDG